MIVTILSNLGEQIENLLEALSRGSCGLQRTCEGCVRGCFGDAESVKMRVSNP